MELKKKVIILSSICILILAVSLTFAFNGKISLNDLTPTPLKGFMSYAGLSLSDSSSFNESDKTNVSLEYIKDNFKVEIGTPTINDGFEITRWDESKFKLEMPIATSEDISISPSNEDKSRINYTDYSVDYYMKDADTFEFDTILREEPSSNVLSWKITLENLICYYQPPLDEMQENDIFECNATNCWDEKTGEIIHTRPMDIVSSYACYHDSKRNNKYMAGKAFHIYRPLIIDDHGWEVYGNLSIDHGELKVIIPQGYLDHAIYPIIVDPIVGTDSCGGSATARTDGQVMHTQFTSAADGGGDLTYIFNCVDTDGSNPPPNFGGAIYEQHASDYPAALVDRTHGQVGFRAWQSNTWAGGAVEDGATISESTDYWLSLFFDGAGGSWNYDSGGDHDSHWSDAWPPNDPASRGWTQGTNMYSSYANYTGAPSDVAPEVTLSTPPNETLNVLNNDYTFGCNVTDDFNIANTTLYIWNSTGIWNNTEINTSTGSTSFNYTWDMTDLPIDMDFTWNCLSYDNATFSTWGSSNRTFYNRQRFLNQTGQGIVLSTDSGFGGGENVWDDRIFYDKVTDRVFVTYIDSDEDPHIQSAPQNNLSNWTDGGDIDIATLNYGQYDCVLDQRNSTDSYLHCVYTTGSSDSFYYRRIGLDDSQADYTDAGDEYVPFDSSSQGGESADDIIYPTIDIDSNNCLLIAFNFRDDSEDAANEHEVVLMRENITDGCGDGVWAYQNGTDLGFPIYSIQEGTGYDISFPIGLNSFGDLDAQLFWVNTTTPGTDTLTSAFFNGTSNATDKEIVLDYDIDYDGNVLNYYSLIRNQNSTITFSMDDGTNDLDAYITKGKNTSLDSQIDTNLNIPTTISRESQVTAVVNTKSENNTIWLFGVDQDFEGDIYLTNSTDGGATWGERYIWIHDAATDEISELSAAFDSENCNIYVTWLNGSASPWEVMIGNISVGGCIRTNKNPEVTIYNPLDNTVSKNQTYQFNCNATDDSNIANTTLYIWNSTGIWNNTEINTSTGSTSFNYTWDITNFNVDNYTWNCLSYDNETASSWGVSNFSLNVTQNILPEVTIYNPLDNTLSRNQTYQFNCNVTDDTGIINTTLYIWNSTGIWNNTEINTSTGSTSFNYTWDITNFNVDNYTWNCLSYDDNDETSFGVSNFSLNVTLDTLPTVILDIPTNGTSSLTDFYDFQCNVTDDYNIQNTTLYIWNSTNGIYYNTTNISVSTNLNYSWSLTSIPFDTYHWNCFSYDDWNQTAWAVNNFTVTIQQDSTKPYFTDTQSNDSSIFQNDIVNFSTLVNDNWNLTSGSCWLEINQSGNFINSTLKNISGTISSCSNVTEITAPTDTNVTWRFWANDTQNNLNSSITQSFIVVGTNAEVNITNTTFINQTVFGSSLYVVWDNIDGNPISSCVLTFNNTNYTGIITGSTTSCYYNLTTEYNSGNHTFKVWLNDTSDNSDWSNWYNVTFGYTKDYIDGYWVARSPINLSSRYSGHSNAQIFGDNLGNDYDFGILWRAGREDSEGRNATTLGTSEKRHCGAWTEYMFDEENISAGKIEEVYCHSWLLAKDMSIVKTMVDGNGSSFQELEDSGIWWNSLYDVPGNASNFNLGIYFIKNKSINFFNNKTFFNTSILYTSNGIQTLSYVDQRTWCIINTFNGANLTDNATLQANDFDGDGVSDFDELFTNFTDPTRTDTDLDGFSDLKESQNNKKGWDPYDWGNITKYVVNKTLSVGTNASWEVNISGGLAPIIDPTLILKNQFDNIRYDNISINDYNNMQQNSTGGVGTNWTLIQKNFRFNITNDIEDIARVNVFITNKRLISGTFSDTNASKVIYNVSGGAEYVVPGGIGPKEGVSFSRLDNNGSDIINSSSGEILIGTTFLAEAGGTASTLTLSTDWVEVWIIEGTDFILFNSPTSEIPVTTQNNTNITIAFDFFETTTEVVSGVTIENITINGSICTLQDEVVWNTTDWVVNCTTPNLANDVYDISIFANTTSAGTLNTTEINAVVYGPTDTCSPGASLTSDHLFECSDECVIDSNLDANGYNITINGTGFIRFLKNISNAAKITIQKTCEFYLQEGGQIN